MSKAIDISGQRYGKLVAIKCVGRTKNKSCLWLCKCDCGNEIIVATKDLRFGNKTSCGCVHNHIGERYGRLVIKEYLGYQKGHRRYLCQCDCGKTKDISYTHLRNGHVRSCGCLQNEARIITHTTHNKSDTRLFRIWAKIEERCYSPQSKAYRYYGGRGIKVCDEWRNDFQSFYDWAMANGYKEDLTIDRIDVNGNYEPNNCRWATMQQQQNNRRNNRVFIIENQRYTLAQLSREYNINSVTLSNRLKRGLSLEEALSYKRGKK